MGAPRECRGPCLLSGLCGEEALVRARACSCALAPALFPYLFVSSPNPHLGGGLFNRLLFLRCSPLHISSAVALQPPY
jgi:hypothetical protein